MSGRLSPGCVLVCRGATAPPASPAPLHPSPLALLASRGRTLRRCRPLGDGRRPSHLSAQLHVQRVPSSHQLLRCHSLAAAWRLCVLVTACSWLQVQFTQQVVVAWYQGHWGGLGALVGTRMPAHAGCTMPGRHALHAQGVGRAALGMHASWGCAQPCVCTAHAPSVPAQRAPLCNGTGACAHRHVHGARSCTPWLACGRAQHCLMQGAHALTHRCTLVVTPMPTIAQTGPACAIRELLARGSFQFL